MGEENFVTLHSEDEDDKDMPPFNFRYDSASGTEK